MTDLHKQTKIKKSRLPKWILALLLSIAAVILICLTAHTVVLLSGRSHFLELEYSDGKIVSGLPGQKTDCILILGAGLRNGYPSPMLQERLDLGAALYYAGASDRILVSGDNGSKEYNEVQAMEDYLVEQHNVPHDAIVKDYAGFSTYDSMYRADYIFCVESAIVVTQKYHLFRAAYIASNMGIETYGADAHRTSFSGNQYREVRECAARIKDFFSCIFRPKPKYLGEKLPIRQ